MKLRESNVFYSKGMSMSVIMDSLKEEMWNRSYYFRFLSLTGIGTIQIDITVVLRLRLETFAQSNSDYIDTDEYLSFSYSPY